MPRTSKTSKKAEKAAEIVNEVETCGVSNVNKKDSNGKSKQKKTVQTPRKHKLSAAASKTTNPSDLPSTSAKKVKGLKCPRIEIREKSQNRSVSR